MKAIRKSDGKIIDVEVHGWNGDCAISYHTDFKDFYKPEDLDFNVPKESEQSSSFDWQSFRAETAKDILCAMINRENQFLINGKTVLNPKDFVEMSIQVADKLIAKLKGKEEK